MRRPPLLRILNSRFLGDSAPVLARCLMHPLALYDEPAGGGGAGKGKKDGDGDGEGGDAILSEFRKMLASAVSSGKVSREDAQIIKDNFKLRRRVGALKIELDAAQKASKVPEGALVLTADQKKEWDAFVALNLPAAKVKEVVDERDKLKKEAAEHAHAQLLDEVAAELDYDPDTLQDLVTTKQLHVEFRDVRTKDEDNKTIVTRVPHVRPKADDKAALEPLHDYAERELSEAVFTMLTTRKVGDEDGDDDSTSGGTFGTPSGTNNRGDGARGSVRLPAARQQRQPSGAAQLAKTEERAVERKREEVSYL